MEVKDTLTLMIGFGMLLVALLTLVVNIIVALIQNKKK
ncbi:putative holin-like toxin [Paenibacillus ehimensis]|nr:MULTISPECIES: putative holin-like toxin [Paenibacillus]MCP1310035.1 putative holin-like toxin [Paenibacillus tyrfis]MEC0208958.1 putative holin-like toxin [Paenibacillus ehimensis]